MPASCRPGDLVLLAFSYSGATESKRRPALVVFDAGDDDVVVVRVTSQPSQGPFDLSLSDWRQAGLLLPSVARLGKIATLEKRLVERRLGGLAAADWQKAQSILRRILAQT